MSSTTDFDVSKPGGGKRASAFLACPYCRKSRYKSLRALNIHISQIHYEESQLRPGAVLVLVLGAPKAEALLSLLRGRGALQG